MLEEIINKLQRAELNGQRLFVSVSEAVDLAKAMQAPLKNSPVAYVVEISRRPSSDSRTIGRPMQNIKTEIGVVIGISKVNDPQGTKTKAKVAPILMQTRKTLFGFEPNEDCSALLMGNADPIGVTKDTLWQLERFTTEHLEVAENV